MSPNGFILAGDIHRAVTRRPLLEVRNLSVELNHVRRHPRRDGNRSIVQSVTFDLASESATAIIGASGSGKTTLARTLVGFNDFTGEIRFHGSVLDGAHRPGKADRRRIHLVLQHAGGSLDPHLAIGQSIAEPMHIHHANTQHQTRENVDALIRLVGLPANCAARRPAQLSGGQQQRAVLARAMAVNPDLLIIDEPLHALDAPSQVELLDLLTTIRHRYNTAILLLTHHLGHASLLCDRLLVMADGRIVDRGKTHDLLTRPTHSATRALLAAARGPDESLQFHTK